MVQKEISSTNVSGISLNKTAGEEIIADVAIDRSSVRWHWYDLIVEEGKYDPLMYRKGFLESRH